MFRTIRRIIRDVPQHWVGDGFPVRSLFSYRDGPEFDPFLLLDYAGPESFPPTSESRGVEEHPHRGFETVTIVYQGELEHRDSSGSHGTISAGDVQWMTAASGVVHEEFHSKRFAREGGMFEVVQLWVNLPAKYKREPPKYQLLSKSEIPVVSLPANSGTVRVIAGSCLGTEGLAKTHTPINVWDCSLVSEGKAVLEIPAGHHAMLVVQQGELQFDRQTAVPVELVLFHEDGDQISLEATLPSRSLILTGLPLREPVIGQGPFVMNTREEISQAIRDYQSGLMGRLE